MTNNCAARLVWAGLALGLIAGCGPAPWQASSPRVELAEVAPYESVAPSADLAAAARKQLWSHEPEEKARDEWLTTLTVEEKQSLFWRFLADGFSDIRIELSLAREGTATATSRVLYSGTGWLCRSLGVEAVPVLLAGLRDSNADVRFRTCLVAGGVGWLLQDPGRLDPRFATLIDRLVTLAAEGPSEADRRAALDALEQYHGRIAPWVHRLALLLGDPSPEIRRSAAWTMRQCGPAAVLHIDPMLAQFDIRAQTPQEASAVWPPSPGSSDQVIYEVDRIGPDADIAAWIMYDMHWAPQDAGLRVLSCIRDEANAEPLNYIIPYLPGMPAVTEALLALPPGRQGIGSRGLLWVQNHAAGDRRFIRPLLAAMVEDWHSAASRQQKDAEESGKAPPTEPVYESCWETPELAKALIAVGRGDKELAATLAALLDGPAPPEAQPYVAWALSEASGNPALLVDGLIRILDAPDPKAYSWGRVMDLLAEVDPTQSERLRPYHARLAAMAESGNGGFGYFMLTGDVGPLEKQCRDDIDRSTRRHSISHVLTYSIFHYGAVAAPLAAKMIRLMETGTAHEKHDVAAALVAVGPTPETRGTAASLRALVEGFKPQSRVAPAMALWSCCGRSDEAVDILVPLLEDHGWATTHASWALGQMGRDARSALPRLRNLARSRNAAYAKWASEAVALIEAELSRKVTPRAVYEELGAANYLVSIRALRHFKDMGRSAAPAVRGCLEREATDRLPGALARQQARARQVLALLAGE